MNTSIRIACLLGSIFCALGVARAQDAEPLPAKPPGVVRVGIMLPKVQGNAGNAAQLAEATRNLLAENLNGPTLEVLLLNARISAQALQEARFGDCDYIVFSTLIHKKGGGGGMFGQTLSNVANAAASTYVPEVNPVTSAAMNGALQSAADYATTVQARDEMRLDYKLLPLAAESPVIEKSLKKKAQDDGQDLMTPLVQGAAEAIGNAVTGN